jgi:hypothetical protein
MTEVASLPSTHVRIQLLACAIGGQKQVHRRCRNPQDLSQEVQQIRDLSHLTLLSRPSSRQFVGILSRAARPSVHVNRSWTRFPGQIRQRFARAAGVMVAPTRRAAVPGAAPARATARMGTLTGRPGHRSRGNLVGNAKEPAREIYADWPAWSSDQRLSLFACRRSVRMPTTGCSA